MTLEEIKKLIQDGEKIDVEFKESRNQNHVWRNMNNEERRNNFSSNFIIWKR